jgi:EmrB/QacA subfamily drug resistance transporter
MKGNAALLITLMIGTFMAGLDSSIVNVSLPSMRAQFNCGLDDIQWVITAYMLSFSIFMPLVNWLRSRIGFFYLYIISLSVFTVGSLLCGLSNSLSTLIIARVIQALGGGAITPTAMAIMSIAFPREKRGQAIGWWGVGTVFGPALGPTIGGVLTQQFGWPSIFFVNLPFGVLAVVLSFRTLQKLRLVPHQPMKFDTSGFLSLSFFLVALQYCIARIERIGLLSFEILFTIGITLASLWLFVKIEARKEAPVINLKLFRNPTLVSCLLITVVRSAALYGGLFLLPFLLQGLMGYAEIESGLIMLPGSLIMALLMPYSGSWSDRHGPRNICLLGLLLLACSMLLFSVLNLHGQLWLALTAMSVRGLGMGLLVSPLNTAIVNSVSKEQVTMASALNSLVQQVSGSAGIAVLAFVHQRVYHAQLQAQVPVAIAEHQALKDGFWISCFLILVALWPASRIPGFSVTPSKEAAIME